MKIALCGATGRVGSRILNELRMRGHAVVALCRSGAILPAHEGVAVVIDDLNDAARTAENIRGVDALVSAYGPPPEDVEELVGVTERLIRAIERSGVPRFLMVGGAGTLEVSPGVTLLESGNLPAEWRPIAAAHAKALAVLRASAIHWTSLSPAAYFDPGERTGRFRLAGDTLLFDEHGGSRISMEDYAIAMVDEVERPSHDRARFSVAY